MTFDLMNYIDEKEEEFSGGGGLVTKVSVTGGWLALASGVNSEDRFYPFTSNEEGEIARAQALTDIEENGWKNSQGKKAVASMAIRVTIHGGDNVLNRDEAPFEGEITRHFVTFGDAYRKVFKEMSVPDWYNDYEWGTDIWAHVLYAEDPDRPTYTNDAGEEKANLVPYIASVYNDRAEASAAAFAMMNEGDYIEVIEQPENYPYEDWDAFYRKMVVDFRDGNDTSEYYELEDFGVSKQVVAQASRQAKQLNEEDDIPF